MKTDITKKQAKKEYDRRRYLELSEKIKARSREYNKQHIEKRHSYNKLWYVKNIERERDKRDNYYKNNSEMSKQRAKDYYKRKKPEIICRIVIYNNKKRKEDEQFYTRMRLRCLFNYALNHYGEGKKYKISEYGVDIDAIVKRLGKKPSNNHQIDHIIPLSLFDLRNSEHIKKAFSPENHQWLTAEQNLSKGNRVIWL